MKHVFVRCLVAMPVVAVAFACSGNGDNAVSGPSNNIPTVAGNYSGSTNIVVGGIGSGTCPTTTSVTQSGSAVSIAPLQLRGAECGNSSIPMGDFVIDSTGSLGLKPATGTTPCGPYNITGSGGFLGRDLRLSIYETPMSGICPTVSFSITLTKS